MAARFTLSIRDFSGERSAFGVPGVSLTAVNFTAQDVLWDTLQTSVQAITIGNVARRQLLAQDEVVTAGNPSDPYAQRESKWLVTWSDDVTGDLHQTEIATPDLSLLVAGSDLMNISGGAGATFVTAFEAVVRGDGLNAVSVDSIRFVGRNL